ncbi:MAG: TetR/AcrR family transcriptional regulator [Streptosporangiales bacterium]
MTEMAEAPPQGRRERKKQATRRAIKQAALTLALERGIEHLTVEEISEAADVSPRTFFNYFSCKEDALIGEAGEAAAELRELIAQRPADEAPLRTLRVALRESELLSSAHATREHALARQRLVHANPSLLPRQLAQYATIERALTEAMAERLGVDPDDDLRPQLLAALAGSVVKVAMKRWTANGTRRPAKLVDEAFDVLEQGAVIGTQPQPAHP